MSCGVGCRCSLDPALLWLWRRPMATTLIGPVAWEPPYATGEPLEKAKRQKKKEKEKEKRKRKEKRKERRKYKGTKGMSEEQLGSSPVAQWVKDLALSLQQLGSLL